MSGILPLFDELLWIHDPTPHPGVWNMAVDQALLEMTSVPLLRTYTWDQPTITIGYAQNLTKLEDQLPPWPIVRRWTGGGVVFHQQDWTYTLMVPQAHPFAGQPPLQSYASVHSSLAAALVAAGHNGCRLAMQEDLIDLPFCFVAPALHDVIAPQGKVAGAGQRRGQLGLLHQGSIQRVELTAAFWQDWAGQLAAQVRAWPDWQERIQSRATALVEGRYALPDWLHHRQDLLQQA